MARTSESKKRGPVPHKIFSDRGLRLEKAHTAQECSNIHYGKPVVIGQDEQGDDIRVNIGDVCPKCRKKVRGFNHEEGAHHRGTVKRHSRR